MITDHTELLEQYGIDYNNAIERFAGNIELYERLARKYLHDLHYFNMLTALERSDVNTAYHEAHALKGVAGNLSFSALYQAASNLEEALRENDIEAAHMLFPAIRNAHEDVINALSSLEEPS